MIPIKELALAAAISGVLGPWASAHAAEPIDINTATAETLAMTIDGVGPARAADIVTYREQNGPFASVDDLALVRGVGVATVERSRANLKVGNAE